MRIDRDAFLVALAALSGCEQDTHETRPVLAPIVVQQRPAVSAQTRALPEPVAPPVVEVQPVDPPPVVVPEPAPKRPTAHRHRSPTQRWFLGLAMADRTNVTAACENRAHAECQRILSAVMPRARDEDGNPIAAPETAEPENPAANLPAEKLDAYCKADFPAPSCETPLVVAFDNQPVEFAQATSARFAFVPGQPMVSDWPTATTPWIALDLDGDGAITSGAELFGSSTVIPGGRATNGFLALAPLDANGDGQLDARDPMFAKLVLWSDRDGDHRSSPDELRPLASVVTRISLAFTRDARCTDRDDCEGERGALHWTDAAGADHTGTVVDVYIPSK